MNTLIETENALSTVEENPTQKTAMQTRYPISHLTRKTKLLGFSGDLEREITGVEYDSRRIQPGNVFVAVSGLSQDGSKFIEEAVARGATAIVSEHPASNFETREDHPTFIHVADARAALAQFSNEFYASPSDRLKLTGITGSNGKTTTSYLLESIFNAADKKTGVLGTINYRYGGKIFPASFTTPESSDLNRMLGEMADQNIEHCFLEISSHALILKRAFGLNIEVGVFTNLTRDHLDFHETMDDYKNAKKLLFGNNHVKKAVLNIDDPAGKEIFNELSMERLSIGIHSPADIFAENVRLSDKGTSFDLKTPSGNVAIDTSLLGLHNVHNLLTATAVAFLQGLVLADIVKGIRSLGSVPGRFESINLGQDFAVIVDYAHTDDALSKALHAARAVTKNRLIVVFGCGGNRDRGKRELMGQVALELSDYAIITSDNPRREEPQSIIDDILTGLPEDAREGDDYEICIDRKSAIFKAIGLAKTGDLILIAGKGHEDYQIIGTEKINFDDRKVSAQAIRERVES
ncbi:MAG: UDP-N-acetylmuramoyl-L-alanyl-D-glutamate--2,6-diaminopimelate ligase [Nitrospinae bacterium CG11_big_fil_rev_8_21_14_0_20_45_15]|nr:MAG: UDP-N-acetylmuramoyl-L-alanyl-D-glutamate--2,6-diaminopimelate ligase [Nitrospinae bacterium CG11_big_fil_rev_8_21_14_0_20_45_15]